MSIRKIPLKERPAFDEDNCPRVDSPGDGTEDPAVSVALGRIRQSALKDRALHDKVCCASCPAAPSAHKLRCVIGCEGVRLIRTRIFQA